jgi:selenocysteine-specific elongation factor
MLLVIDATKGVQTQTAECIVISELLLSSSLLVVINKIDLVDSSHLEQVEKRVRLVLSKTKFRNSFDLVKVSANPKQGEPVNIQQLLDVLVGSIQELPDRSSSESFYCEVDHCFPVKGLGCVLTGTILRGSVSVNDSIELLSLNTVKKVKSIQSFHQNIGKASKGDRVGICIGPFDSSQIERGVICTPGSVRLLNSCVMKVEKIQYFKHQITGKSKYHITCGNQTVMGTCVFFSANNSDFDPQQVFQYENELVETKDKHFFALLRLESPINEPLNNSLLIGSKFDLDCNAKQCRIAFWGRINCVNPEISHRFLKISKEKRKIGKVERIVDQFTAIACEMFSKETDISKFQGLKVTVEGREAVIVGSFGKSGKFKISFNGEDAVLGEVELKFKKLLWDKTNALVQ